MVKYIYVREFGDMVFSTDPPLSMRGVYEQYGILEDLW